MKQFLIRCSCWICGLLILLFSGGCTSNEDLGIDEITLPNTSDGMVTLRLQVCSDVLGVSTRAEEDEILPVEFEKANDLYEKIHSLRVIIVRPDNTIEHNHYEEIPEGWASNKFKEIELKVSTDQGEMELDVRPTPIIQTRTERKRIYLIANEESIQPSTTLDYIKSLLPPHYVIENGENKFINGAELKPEMAAGWEIYNTWDDMNPNGNEAVPMIDNTGTKRQFVPMTEFFDIDVVSDLTLPDGQNVQKETMFVTRNLVKFQFSINENSTLKNFLIKEIKFEELMQKEYLFPQDVVYNPSKYLNNKPGKINQIENQEREITSFKIPYNGNILGTYTFKPTNFGLISSPDFEGVEHSLEYNPYLYFCETKTLNGSENNFKVGVTVEFLDPQEEVFEGPVIYAPIPISLPYALPRNTIVKVNISINNKNELVCTVTLLPYTCVTLTPEFGL